MFTYACSNLKKIKPYVLYTPLCVYLWSFLFPIHAKEGAEPRCDKGNFALPPSQVPGPFLSFGENIIPRGQTQLLLFGVDFIGHHKHYININPSILYGITDDFSVFFSLPFAGDYQENKKHSQGISDLFLQFEYAIYTAESSCTSHALTFVANASCPTGSIHKTPPTGFGSISYFIGTTYSYTAINWLCFTSYGVELPTSHQGTKFGNQYLYQWGIGRNIASTQQWIFEWIVELNGLFSERDRIAGTSDPNSGGNVIYLTPSLWASSPSWIFQLGVGGAIQQNLFGNQKREQFLLAFNIGRTF